MATLNPLAQAAILRRAFQMARASFWFKPACLVVLAVVLAWLGHVLDNWDALDPPLPDALAEIEIEGARALLSTMASAIMGVTGVTFSVTIVAVTYASSQHGPRLVTNFLRDRGAQWSLGILISNFVFALLTLLYLDANADSVPKLSVGLALIWTLASVGTIIYFVHHVPEIINVANINAGLGNRLIEMIRKQIDGQDDTDTEDEEVDEILQGEPTVVAHHTSAGYIQAISFERLRDLAERENLVLRFHARPGAFTDPSQPLVSAWGETDEAALRDAIDDAVLIGSQPTEDQTVSYLADKLVEMTALALSPGVNDPFTAIDCLNRLAAGLAVALTYRGGLEPREGGRVRYPLLDFETLYSRTFPAAMDYVVTDRIVREHAIGLLEHLTSLDTERDRSGLLRDLRRLRAA